jgi:hypothetical protein
LAAVSNPSKGRDYTGEDTDSKVSPDKLGAYIKLPNKIPSSSFDKNELRALVKAKSNAKSYKPEAEKGHRKLAELYIGSCVEYSQYEKAITESYMSGDKKNREHNRLREKSFELYNDKWASKRDLSIEEPDWKPPEIRNCIGGNYSLPNNYLISEYGDFETRTIAVSLPKQFLYSGTIDTYINLLRHSGYTKELGYTFSFLDWGLNVMMETSLVGDEWEILRYLYDQCGFAYQFATENWLQALLKANRGPRRVVGFRKTHRVQLTGSEHIQISSREIPFELEGIFFTATFEELKEAIELYRVERPPFLYTIGECDDARYPIYHLFYTKKGGKDPEETRKFLTTEGLSITIEKTKLIKERLEPRPEASKKEYEPLFYYASTSEREELMEKFHESARFVESIALMAQLGYRELTYQVALSMADREGVNERLHQHYCDEDELLAKLNSKYGTNIRRTNILEDTEDFFGDDESEGGFFDFMEEPAEPEEEMPPIHEEPEIPGHFEHTHTESLTDWVSAQQEGGTLHARIVWDPGGQGYQHIPRV